MNLFKGLKEIGEKAQRGVKEGLTKVPFVNELKDISELVSVISELTRVKFSLLFSCPPFSCSFEGEVCSRIAPPHLTSQGARHVIALSKNMSEAEMTVDEATNNEPWGPHGSTMSKLAEYCHDPKKCREVLGMVSKKLQVRTGSGALLLL